MLTIERLEEMRQNELRLVQRPFMKLEVKKVAGDYAEALGELIERRHAVVSIPVITQAEMWGSQ